jgi:formylmethanofuran dehydrogenase subunit B
VAKLQVMEITKALPQANTLTCPACGMLCDDIRLNPGDTLKVSNGCQKSVAFFEQPLNTVTSLVNGEKTDLSTAIQHAIAILQNASQPLIAGLGTEVHGMRAILNLAQKTGAILDHMHSAATVCNTLALQHSGWQTTTLTEIKNRADVILAIGTDIVSSHPRFLEKLVHDTDSLFEKATPEILYLGKDNPDELPQLLNMLNALALRKPIHATHVGSTTVAFLQAILEKLTAAQYGVIVWSASKLNHAHAELTVESITRLIRTLNETTRIAGLPLNSGDGDTTINNTSTWNTGFASNVRFIRKNTPEVEFKPDAYSGAKALAYADALLWISSFNAIPPLTTVLPTIVIGHPNTAFQQAPDVFIPVGIPGLDHSGTMFRLDSAVALPLKRVRATELPTLSEVINRISNGMSDTL